MGNPLQPAARRGEPVCCLTCRQEPSFEVTYSVCHESPDLHLYRKTFTTARICFQSCRSSVFSTGSQITWLTLRLSHQS